MENVVLLLLCFALGILFRRSGRFPEGGYVVVNATIVQLAMPALILRNVHELTLTADLLAVAAMPWLIFGVGIVLFVALGRRFGWTRQTVGALAVTAGFGNNAFIGLPMVEAFYGPAMVGVGAISAQLGVNIGTNTAGIVTAAWFGSGGTVSAAAILRRIGTFPPFQAFVLALLLKPVEFPDLALNLLGRLGAMLGPLAMLSVGLQLKLSDTRDQPGPLAAGVLYKILLAPLLAAIVTFGALGMTGTVADVIVFQAAMGPQVAGAIVANEFRLNGPLAALVVGVGTAVSMVTVILCWLLLGGA